jgi:phosphate-selective porin
MYNITGEKWSNTYKDGTFGGTRPLANFSSSGKGIGAWQVGMRVSSYDANDWVATTATTGSKKGSTTTLGVNWILNPNARIMLNHSTTKFDTAFAASAATGDKETVTTLRTQINF